MKNKAAQLERLMDMIAAGCEGDFYRTRAWKDLSAHVREMDRNECVLCRQRGRYRRAVLVHHVNHLTDRPDLALDIYYLDSDGNQKRNLISVCRTCHETVCHPEKAAKEQRAKKHVITTERWD